MHTISRLDDSETLTDGRPAAVDAFLETLREEQATFLASVRRASAVLGRESGQLAHIAAIHSRLTQQFFDAQRQIMTRRAEFDDEVARISLRAERDLAVVGSNAEVDALDCVIDDAFLPGEPDGVAPQQQLALLLDEWWTAENRDGQATIERAHARAEMKSRVARIETGEIVVMTDEEPPQLLPPIVSDLLDEADSVDLETLLAQLAESLQPSPTAPESVDQCSERPGERRARLVLDVASTEVDRSDMTREFWTEPSTLAASRRTVRWARSSAADAPRPGRHDRR